MIKKMNNPAWFLIPYWILFGLFIIVPTVMAILLSFTYFNSIQTPEIIGVKNYIELITMDTVFMQDVIPNTLKFSLIVGPLGYILAFLLAWMLAQIPKRSRTILAIIFYSPSLTMGVAMAIMWRIIFSGDANGYLNSILLNQGLILEPIQWLQSPEHLMKIMIIVSLWGSMGVGFLAMLSGILNIDQTLYEAAYVDGIRNRTQEILYITIPQMKPQMLFGAIMAVVGTFNSGAIGVALSGSNPTPQNAGQLIVNHIDDFGFSRYLMGYASAIGVVLLLMVYAISKVTQKVLATKED
ncbi:MAG: sugar ABC transporter permease [Acholeplasmatales bacterium]|jgi:multiple sugar transport system permease protein|nr:sugar ABC transporter permease [Acholeplasmataceae bacterium]MCK9289577.1 sugar ABC transporter permease [Acholeplasmataceae bacterium]MCK9428010.1 sugar ABC transporter permease [Acholeplasmataceae bacterium]MDY0115676.1 sugar ABC transporter permease [Acholeplasmatales bacterium]HHT39275.1 sugar ABC transporter permease [Acholeplasmataceae bacterium]